MVNREIYKAVIIDAEHSIKALKVVFVILNYNL